MISATVFREVFGDPIKNVVGGEFLGAKLLVDQEPAVRDVCEDCNNVRLSPYDAAGVDFIRQVIPSNDPTGLRIKFSREAIGWLIKTHLNYFRVIKDRETQTAYVVDQSIKDALIQHRPVPVNRYRLFVEGWIGEDYFWDAEDPRHIPWFEYRSVKMRSQIVISEFRIKTLVTWFIVPSDCDYRRFNERVLVALEDVKKHFGFQPLQMIDPRTAVQDGYVPLRQILSLDEVKSYIRKREVSE